MKAYLLVVALAVVAACGKKNDAPILEHEAIALAKYYRPQVEELQKRYQDIWNRGTKIPGNLPDVPELGRRLKEADETLTKLRAIVIEPGPENLEKRAEAAANDNKVDELKRIVHDNEVALERGVTVVTDDLSSVESWIEQFDRKTLASMAPVKPADEAPPAPAGASEPGTPDAQSTPATGQPPPAAAPAAGGAKKDAAPKAEQPKAPQPKAEQAKQPAPAQPKQPAPAPAQPKQPAPAPAPAQPKQP